MTGRRLTGHEWVLLGTYLAAAGAGATGLIWTPPAIQEALSGPWPTLWAVLMLAGGSVCACAVLRRRWLGEYAGLPALLAAMLTYVGAAIHLAISSGHQDPRRWPASLVLLVGYGLLLHRWLGARDERRAAVRRQQVHHVGN